MKFTRIPETAFKNLQLNAGILLRQFTPSTAQITETDLLGATTGGVAFTATPTYTDYGEDIDNAPVNVLELKRLDSWAVTLSGTFITLTPALAKLLVGAADVDSGDDTKIVPRNDVKSTDFQDIWWVGDYSEINEDGSESGKAGFVAIHMLNGLSTGGFQLQSNNRGKGNFAFEFTGHYSIDAQDTVPFEVYVSEGSADAA